MLTELNAEQTALMARVRDEWIAEGMRTESQDAIHAARKESHP